MTIYIEVNLKSSITLLMRFGLLLFICAGCSNGDDQAQDEEISSIFDINDTHQSNQLLDDLFHDTMQFTRDDLQTGSTNCTDILDEGHIEDRIITWPSEVKNYFLENLSKFPNPDLISQSVHGIYLVTDATLYDQKSKTTAAGLACDRGSDFKGIIFLNYNSVIKRRSSLGIGAWQETRSKTNKYIDIIEGDTASITLMHEIFHAIDIKLFMHGTPENLQKRENLKSKSWIGDEPIFKRGPIIALNGSDDASADSTDHRCTHPIHSGLSLTAGSSAEELAAELKRLQEQTNFIVPYTMASPAEDFAETLTVYYFGVFHQSWQKRTVSFEKKPLFVHDTESILRTKKQHIDKTCALAKLVFGRCEL